MHVRAAAKPKARARARAHVPRRKVPPDVARLLAVYEQLGRAARWGQHVHERVMRRQLRDAARRARALEKRLRS